VKPRVGNDFSNQARFKQHGYFVLQRRGSYQGTNVVRLGGVTSERSKRGGGRQTSITGGGRGNDCGGVVIPVLTPTDGEKGKICAFDARGRRVGKNLKDRT